MSLADDDTINTSSGHNDTSLGHNERHETGLLIVNGLSKPLIDNLNLISDEIENTLMEQADKARAQKRLNKKDMALIVLELCSDYYLTQQVLAQLLNRQPVALRKNTLKPLLDQGRLALAFPQTPTHSKQAYEILMEKMDVASGLFHGFDYSDYETNALQLLPLAMNHILGLEDGKKRFLDVVLNICKAFTLCGTLDEVQPLKKEIAFLSAVKAAISKYTSIDKKRTEADKSSALKQIIDNAIVADGVADVFELAGLEKPNIGLLSHEFLDDLAKMKTKNLAVELLERLIKDEIKARMKNDVVQEKTYSDRILETLRKYHNRAIETAQVIEELIQMAKDMAKDEEIAKKSGLNSDEIAFYRALIQNESAVRKLGDNNLRQLAKDVTQRLKKSTTVDWQVRDSVRAKLRILIRRALKRWKYPPDGAKEAVELVLKQAEALSNSWTQ